LSFSDVRVRRLLDVRLAVLGEDLAALNQPVRRARDAFDVGPVARVERVGPGRVKRGSYLMKSPPVQIVDHEAYQATEKFIAQNARTAKASAATAKLTT
jgi:hypothetical protein